MRKILISFLTTASFAVVAETVPSAEQLFTSGYPAQAAYSQISLMSMELLTRQPTIRLAKTLMTEGKAGHFYGLRPADFI